MERESCAGPLNRTTGRGAVNVGEEWREALNIEDCILFTTISHPHSAQKKQYNEAVKHGRCI
jgi:hypothetical protein